ncbi:SDR family oxidoreductase [Bradyrhizobium lablabi]|uniref:SDR family oxidoreductase n=1 Tax=Bradyrhizobium lablabi TaxID=722472 RepID=UPI001BA5DD59|nr:SDR family oxidoreductase [Bradyrhizobium lablabi]MBR0692875.1 SDR family oxidoreductase [Bradyrhizobium lablabi]
MRIALVTGAGRRLGAVIAQLLSRNGFKVIVHVNRSRTEGQAIVRRIVDDGGAAALVACDFSRPDRIPNFFGKIVEHHGMPELIVNNASAFSYDFPGKASAAILDTSLAVHVKTPFLLLELAYKSASRRRPVTVVNILDQKVVNLNPDYYSYTIGKCGLYAVTRLWQMNPTDRMRVFGILPGLLYPSGKQTARDFDRVKSDTVLRRNPSPEEIANTVLFFADNKSIPGQNLAVDGGESLVRRTRDIAYE